MIGEIAAQVAENESLGAHEVRVLMAPVAGYDAAATKAIVSLFARDRVEKVFVKISNSEKLGGLLQSEAESINACNALGVRGIPEVLASGSIEGRYFFAQRYIAGPSLHGRPGYLDSALAYAKDWVAELYAKSRGPAVEPAELLRRGRENAERASGFFDLDDCLELMERLSPGVPIPTCRIHGDLWHRNMLLHGKELYVTDFAFSAPAEPPIDLIDLVCDYDPDLFLEPKRVQRYSGSLQVDEAAIPFLHVYALVRKIGLKAERRKLLYDELLLNNLEKSMNEITEVGSAKQFVRAHQTWQP